MGDIWGRRCFHFLVSLECDQRTEPLPLKNAAGPTRRAAIKADADAGRAQVVDFSTV